MAEAAVSQTRASENEVENLNMVKHVTFALGGENYAVTAASVNEVLRYTEITPVPGAKSFVLGIINLRGDVVTVLDARSIFGMPREEAAGQTRIVVVEVDDYLVGIMVDRVAAVVDLNPDLVEGPPNTGNEAAAKFIHGVYNDEDELLILVDFHALTDL